MSSPGATLLAWAAACGSLALATPQDGESRVDELLRVARTGRTVVRPQAARRLVRLFEGAQPAEREALVGRVLAACGETNADLATIGSALIEVLGDFGDGRLRERLWSAVDDPDFAWRPYAARSLTGGARAAERPRFDALLEDPIAPVRAAAVGAFRVLDERGAADLLRARLADTDDRVRRAAADLLVRWGDGEALWWLLEELHRSDHFFDRPTGEQARFQAHKLLAAHLPDTFGYDPGAEPDVPTNRSALERLEAAVAERAGGVRPTLPAVARAGGAVQGETIGLELRSCRRGEFFLRWTADDGLLVGQGRPTRVALPAGTVARLLARGRTATEAVSDRRFFGQPGCDVEQLSWRPPGEGTTAIWIVSKGPQVVQGLRPAALGGLAAELLATLPEGPRENPRLDHLRSRTRAALAAIGGALD